MLCEKCQQTLKAIDSDGELFDFNFIHFTSENTPNVNMVCATIRNLCDECKRKVLAAVTLDQHEVTLSQYYACKYGDSDFLTRLQSMGFRAHELQMHIFCMYRKFRETHHLTANDVEIAFLSDRGNLLEHDRDQERYLTLFLENNSEILLLDCFVAMTNQQYMRNLLSGLSGLSYAIPLKMFCRKLKLATLESILKAVDTHWFLRKFFIYTLLPLLKQVSFAKSDQIVASIEEYIELLETQRKYAFTEAKSLPTDVIRLVIQPLL